MGSNDQNNVKQLDSTHEKNHKDDSVRIFDISDKSDSVFDKVETESISEKDKLQFAKYILIAMFALFALVSAIHVLWPSIETKEVFDFVSENSKLIFILIVGFYFGKNFGNNLNK